jgi:hypothetical protein
VPTALTGFLDWLLITRWTPLWRVATSHFAAMATAAGGTIVFVYGMRVLGLGEAPALEAISPAPEGRRQAA